jgi:hypothetical protein
MRRGLTSWLVAVPLAVAGSQIAHAIAYRLLSPDADARAHVLAESGHGYFSYLPLAASAGIATVLLALLHEARRSGRGGAAGGLPAWWLGLVAPFVFVLQEHFERFAGGGGFPWDMAAQPVFLVGLALTLPFGLWAYVLARLLVRAARSVGRLLLAPPRLAASAPRASLRPCCPDRPRPAALAHGCGTRGPPLPAV